MKFELGHLRVLANAGDGNGHSMQDFINCGIEYTTVKDLLNAQIIETRPAGFSNSYFLTDAGNMYVSEILQYASQFSEKSR